MSYLTPGEYGIAHQVRKKTVLRWIHGGQLPCVRIRKEGKIYYLIDSRTAPPALRPGPRARGDYYYRNLYLTAKALYIATATKLKELGLWSKN